MILLVAILSQIMSWLCNVMFAITFGNKQFFPLTFCSLLFQDFIFSLTFQWKKSQVIVDTWLSVCASACLQAWVKFFLWVIFSKKRYPLEAHNSYSPSQEESLIKHEFCIPTEDKSQEIYTKILFIIQVPVYSWPPMRDRGSHWKGLLYCAQYSDSLVQLEFYKIVNILKTIKGIHLKLRIVVHYHMMCPYCHGLQPCSLHVQSILSLFKLIIQPMSSIWYTIGHWEKLSAWLLVFSSTLSALVSS